jgi:protein-S-isoprenylcysteine O-methyltransferase Ste14
MGNYPAIMRSKWFLPLFSLMLGVVVLAVSWVGGSLGSGLISLAIMAVFGLLILLAGRSETVRGLRGDGRDERFAQIDLHATAVAGLVVIITLIVAFLTELARGHSGSPYSWLCAIGGFSYLLAVAFFRWRG